MRFVPRFRLRTLLILVTICAILSGWLAVEMQQARKQHEAALAILELGGVVYYDYQFPDCNSNIDKYAPSPIPRFIRSIFGECMFSDVTYVGLEGDSITNKDLVHLGQFPRLLRLRLIGPNLSEDGLSNLASLDEIEDIRLGIAMTDSGLDHLASLESLKELFLLGPDTGAHFLLARDPNKRISQYYRYNSGVTPAGAEELGRKLPSCRIVY